jgi:hypothetical protein
MSWDEEKDLYIQLKAYITLRYDICGVALAGVREAFGYGAASFLVWCLA